MTIFNETPKLVIKANAVDMVNLVHFALGEAQKCLEFYELEMKRFHELEILLQQLPLEEAKITCLTNATKILHLILTRIRLIVQNALQKTAFMLDRLEKYNMHNLEKDLQKIWGDVRQFVIERAKEYFPVMKDFKAKLVEYNLEHVLYN